MKRIFIVGGVLFSCIASAGYVDRVDTRFGAEPKHGSCPIGPQVPHGSVHPSPDTLYPFTGRKAPPPSGYYPGDPVVGFSQLHCQGTGGTPTYGIFLVSPTTGEGDREEDLASPFTVKTAKPHLLEGRLERWDCDVRVSATHHGAIYEFTFPEGTCGRVVVNARRKIGMRDSGQGQFSHEGSVYTADASYFGNWVPGGVWCSFYATEDRVAPNRIVFRVATSFKYSKVAETYHDRELKGRSVDEIAADAKAAWEKKLSAIELVGADAEEETRFYSHFYHTFTQPRDRTDDFFEFADGVPVWDDHYTVWDTWKTLFPLMAITDPQTLASVVNSFAARCERNGFCASAFIGGQEYRVGQGGDDVDNVIADAVVKNIPGVDLGKAWTLLEAHAAHRTRAYREKGYVEDGRPDGYCWRLKSGSATLGFAYNDFCAAEVAEKLGRTAEAMKLRERSSNWTNVWNAAMRDDTGGFTGFVWGRDIAGGWDMIDKVTGRAFPLEPKGGYNSAFYEGSAWEYSWNVWHDPDGLAEKLGGREKAVARLEYALEHELIDFGNEPSFYTPFWFARWGRFDLAAKWAAKVRAKFPARDCLGDDDSGAMGSYYVFLTCGLMPIAGQDLYVVTGPLVPEVRFHLASGRTIAFRRGEKPRLASHSSLFQEKRR